MRGPATSSFLTVLLAAAFLFQPVIPPDGWPVPPTANSTPAVAPPPPHCQTPEDERLWAWGIRGGAFVGGKITGDPRMGPLIGFLAPVRVNWRAALPWSWCPEHLFQLNVAR